MEEELISRQLDFVLLIDDNEADNDFHLEIIKRAGIAVSSLAINHPLSALTYFKNCLTEHPLDKYAVPGLVLLDLLMPAFDGFEVLNQFAKLLDPYGRKKEVKFVLLTGHLSPETSLRAKLQYEDVVIGCALKPLTEANLNRLMQIRFKSDTARS